MSPTLKGRAGVSNFKKEVILKPREVIAFITTTKFW